jgi:hypothetical protein
MGVAGERLENARDIHRAIMSRYAVPRDSILPTPEGGAAAVVVESA